MNLTQNMFLLSSLIPILLFLLSWFISMHTTHNRQKSSPFECGFDPKNSSRVPFSMRFFLLAIIFIIFDVEVALLFPVPISTLYSMSPALMILLFSFIILLFMGLINEWNEGALLWTN